MRSSTRRHLRFIIAASALFVMAASVSVRAQEANVERELTGVWLVSITPRNCETGDPIPATVLRQIWTFHKDGTMLSSFGTNILTLNRTAAHGLWEPRRGWSEYAFKFVHIRQNSSTLAFAGRQESGGRLSLGESGDAFVTEGTTIVYSVDDVPGSPSCSTSAGVRFKLD